MDSGVPFYATTPSPQAEIVRNFIRNAFNDFVILIQQIPMSLGIFQISMRFLSAVFPISLSSQGTGRLFIDFIAICVTASEMPILHQIRFCRRVSVHSSGHLSSLVMFFQISLFFSDPASFSSWHS
jgi:hypothetical protein